MGAEYNWKPLPLISPDKTLHYNLERKFGQRIPPVTKKKVHYPIVIVEWEDAESGHGWEEVEGETDHAIPIVYTCGYLIKELEKSLTVASTVDFQGTSNARLKIPRGMVKTIKYLRK